MLPLVGELVGRCWVGFPYRKCVGHCRICLPRAHFVTLACGHEDKMASTVMVGFEVLWQCWSSEMSFCHQSQRPSPVETIPAAWTGMWGCLPVKPHLVSCVDFSMARPPPFQLLHNLDTWNSQLALSLATGIETTAIAPCSSSLS